MVAYKLNLNKKQLFCFIKTKILYLKKGIEKLYLTYLYLFDLQNCAILQKHIKYIKKRKILRKQMINLKLSINAYLSHLKT